MSFSYSHSSLSLKYFIFIFIYFDILGWFFFFRNDSVYPSWNTLKVFSVFMFLYWGVPFLHWIWFGGNLSFWLLPRLLSLSLLPLLYLPLDVSVLFFIYCFAFPWFPLSSSLGSFGFLFGGLFLLSLSGFFLFLLVLLLLLHMFFSSNTLAFSLLFTHLVSFYSGLWLLLYILHIFSCLLWFFAVEAKALPPNCALFLPSEPPNWRHLT